MGRSFALVAALCGCTFQVAPAAATFADIDLSEVADLAVTTPDDLAESDDLSESPDLVSSPDLTPPVTPVLTLNRANVPGTANLTNEGIVDWTHYGLNMALDVNRKAGVTPIIMHTTTGSVQQWPAFNTMLSWTDGAPTVSATNTNNGCYTAGNGTGIAWVVPSGPTQRTLRVYVGEYRGTGTLTAHLSDGSLADVTDTHTNNNGATLSLFTIVFRTAAAGQLTVSWMLTNDNGTGSVDFLAATLY